MERWAGCVAVVMGAGNEVGNSICRELVQHEFTVVGCDNDVEKIGTKSESEEKIKSEYARKLHRIECDMYEVEDIVETFEQIKRDFDPIDVCITNTCFANDSAETPAPFYPEKSMLMVNVCAFNTCTKEAVKLMMESEIDEGVIINIDSMPRRHDPKPTFEQFTSIATDSSGSWVQQASRSLRKSVKAKSDKINLWSLGVKTSKPDGDEPGPLQRVHCDSIADAVLCILQRPPKETVKEDELDILLLPKD